MLNVEKKTLPNFEFCQVAQELSVVYHLTVWFGFRPNVSSIPTFVSSFSKFETTFTIHIGIDLKEINFELDIIIIT